MIRNVPGQLPLASIICTNKTPDAYYGYEVKVDEEVVESEERRYPKSEWQIADGLAEAFA